MDGAVVFLLVFGGLFLLRFAVATAFFIWVLPEADRCPICDSPTLRVQHRFWNRIFPGLRTSWCYECNWEGLLRPGRLTDVPTDAPSKLAGRR